MMNQKLTEPKEYDNLYLKTLFNTIYETKFGYIVIFSFFSDPYLVKHQQQQQHPQEQQLNIIRILILLFIQQVTEPHRF